MEIECTINHDQENRIWHEKGNELYWHREDGPSVIYDDGKESWWYHDIKYYTPEEMPLNLFLAYIKWEYKKTHGN